MVSVDSNELVFADRKDYNTIINGIDTLQAIFKGAESFQNISRTNSLNARKEILIVSKKSETLIKHIAENPINSLVTKQIVQYRKLVKELKTYTEYSPWWVILLISISLGLGTMVGWKRIVVTIGEKIGKTHLTYAQGASAELVAASTISVSSWLGLPVSTTHVLSSGIAGSMVSGNGFKNLQSKTVAAIGIAWLITLPVTVLFSGMLFLLFRLIFA